MEREQHIGAPTEEDTARETDRQAQFAAIKAELAVLTPKLKDQEAKQLADAQATIVALQARVKELEDDRSAWKEIAQDWGAAAKLAEQPEKFYDGYSAAVMNAMQALLTKARADLARVTAELEAAKAIQVIDLKNNNEYREQVANLQAELERVRGLIKALPKVEGQLEVESGAYYYVRVLDWKRDPIVCGLMTEQATGYAIMALLQHRQGMEG